VITGHGAGAHPVSGVLRNPAEASACLYGMKTFVARACGASFLLLALWVAACGDDDGMGLEDGFVGIAVEPTLNRVFNVGDSVQFLAFGVAANGDREPIEVEWTSAQPSVAVISAGGWARAVDLGATVITATHEEMTAVASLIVDPDQTAPQVRNALVDPPQVDVQISPALVRIEVDFEDTESGTVSGLAIFDGPLGSGSVTGLVVLVPQSESDKEPGLSTFEGFLEIPAMAGAGTWTLAALRADDRAGNIRQWSGQELQDLGFNVTVIARSGQ